jgi:hypothetical protein
MLVASSIITPAPAIFRSSSKISGLKPTAATVNVSVTRAGNTNPYGLEFLALGMTSGKYLTSLDPAPFWRISFIRSSRGGSGSN